MSQHDDFADLLSGPDTKPVDSSIPSSLVRDHSLDDFEHIQSSESPDSMKLHKDLEAESIPKSEPIVEDLLGGFSSSSFSPQPPAESAPLTHSDLDFFSAAPSAPPQHDDIPEIPPAKIHTPEPIFSDPEPEPVYKTEPEPLYKPEPPAFEPEPIFEPVAVIKPEKVVEPIKEVFEEPIKEKVPEPVKEKVEEKVTPVAKPPVEASKPKVTESKKCPLSFSCSSCIVARNVAKWFNPEQLPPKVANLVYWRDPKKSGVVFGAGLVILLSLVYFSLISVLAYTSLITLLVTVSFRIYKSVLQAVQKTQDGHPFKEILELDLAIPSDKVHSASDVAVSYINSLIQELRRLFLAEDLVDSFKFGVLLWCLTYIGGWFNGLTLVILAFVAAFTLPKVYETNKTQIDQNLDLVKKKIDEVSAKVRAAVPIGKKEKEQ